MITVNELVVDSCQDLTSVVYHEPQVQLLDFCFTASSHSFNTTPHSLYHTTSQQWIIHHATPNHHSAISHPTNSQKTNSTKPSTSLALINQTTPTVTSPASQPQHHRPMTLILQNAVVLTSHLVNTPLQALSPATPQIPSPTLPLSQISVQHILSQQHTPLFKQIQMTLNLQITPKSHAAAGRTAPLLNNTIWTISSFISMKPTSLQNRRNISVNGKGARDQQCHILLHML